MEIITIRYNEGRGKMVIYLDAFFPCTQAQMKKLLSVISLDWGHREQITKDIIDFCKEKAQMQESEKKNYANKYNTIRTQRVEAQNRVKERKDASGVPFTKEQLQVERDWVKLYRESEQEYNRAFKKCSKCAELLKKNIEQLESR